MLFICLYHKIKLLECLPSIINLDKVHCHNLGTHILQSFHESTQCSNCQLKPNQANEDQNKVKDKRKDEKEKEQVTSKVLLASRKRFPKQDGHHHSSFSSKAQKEDPMRKHERKNGLEKRDGLTKARGNTLTKDGTRAHKREV